MANKKYIISESAVRRFQKLALVKPINELGMPEAYNRDEGMYEQNDVEDVEGVEDVDVAPVGDVDVDVEEPVMDEPDLEPEVAGGAEEMARTVIQAVADALGVDIDIEGAEGAEGVEDVEGVEEFPGEEVEEFPGEEIEEDEVIDEVDMIDEEELTEAVMKRVVERLKGMAAKSKKA